MSDMQGTKEPPKTKLEILKFVGPIGGAIFIIGGFVCSVSLIPQALTVLCCMYTDPKELRSRGLGRILIACIYIRNNNASSDCTLLGIWSIKSPFICFR